MRDLQLHAAGRIGFDEIDKVPGDGAGRNLLDQEVQGGARSDTSEEAAYGATGTDIDGSNPQDGAGSSAVSYGIDLQFNVINADDLAAVDVDDLLIEQIAIEQE